MLRDGALKVLIVSHGHPEQAAGGGQIASYQLFSELRQRARVTAFYLARSAVPRRGRTGSAVWAYPGRPGEFLFAGDTVDPFLFSQRSRSVIAGFRRLLDDIEPDIVHFQHYAAVGLELIGAVRRYRPQARIVITLHEFMAICHHAGLMVKTRGLGLCRSSDPGSCAACFPLLAAADFAARKQFVRAHFDLADLFIAPSGFLRRRYVEWGLPGRKIVAVDDGSRPGSARPRMLAADDRPGVFGFFGQTHPYKGLVPLLQAFAALAALPPHRVAGIRLVIHGAHLALNAPDYVAEVERLLALTAERVTFAGPYGRDDVDRLMAAVDWVVVPSLWWENAPLVIDEALSRRRPVICSDIGGMAEKVRPGEDGFHFPAGNSAALAELLVRLAASPEVWNRLQTTMRRPTTLVQAADRLLDLYRDPAYLRPEPLAGEVSSAAG